MNCVDCKYWSCYSERRGYGYCKRRAPSAIQWAQVNPNRSTGQDSDHLSMWPVTSNDDWCGEHVAKPLDPTWEPTTEIRADQVRAVISGEYIYRNKE
jgi:hypothetical protein